MLVPNIRSVSNDTLEIEAKLSTKMFLENRWQLMSSVGPQDKRAFDRPKIISRDFLIKEVGVCNRFYFHVK